MHKEWKILRNIVRIVAIAFSKMLILFQLILRNFGLNLSIDWSEILRLKMDY